jgi:pyruvate/2-oxoglutarate dehydrogenase complex dihydrolipoamide dehydrogenase (E3) component
LTNLVSAIKSHAASAFSAFFEMVASDILGTGRFVAPRTVEAALLNGSTRQLRGTNVIVSTGTRASLEPIPGLAEAQPLTHIETLELCQVPEHLLVIGGGYVGVELRRPCGDSAAK